MAIKVPRMKRFLEEGRIEGEKESVLSRFHRRTSRSNSPFLILFLYISSRENALPT